MSQQLGAEGLLRSLGVEHPREIDLEAIAWVVGAEVRYSRLASCEARIIGFGARAIITVDPSRGAARARFSIGHELGHWSHHRGKSSICRADEIGGTGHGPAHPERIADAYAADLLLPGYLFRPEAAKLKRSTFVAVDKLAAMFQSSRTATAMRLVDFGPEPAVLVCHGPNGRRWFKRGRGVPERWFPQADLDAASNAFEVLHGGVEKPQPIPIRADAWFDRREAEQYEVFEQTVRGGNGGVLTMLTFKSPKMLTER